MDTTTLEELKTKIAQTWDLLRLDETRQRVLDLEGQVQDPNFWNNQEQARTLSQELNELQDELQRWEGIQQEVNDVLELAELSDGDEAMSTEIVQKTEELKTRFEELEFYIMLSGEHDANDAIVSIHAGAGGTDSQDWAEMLERMILRFCEQRGWKVTVVDRSRGQEAGIKSVTLQVQGRYAYGYLQSEHGVHRLVRISPFDAEGMRHTSFAMMEVIPDFGEVSEVEINESDLRIDVFRAGGNGGQSVNTTDSAVRIVHEPTGITATCQNEKSQHQNKATAMKILKNKLHQLHLEEQRKEQDKIRGEHQSAEWGNQIRSYVLHPYKMVNDHRTGMKTKNPDAVLDGNLEPVMEEYLRWLQEQRQSGINEE